MYCPNCGNKSENEDKFCAFCGYRLDKNLKNENSNKTDTNIISSSSNTKIPLVLSLISLVCFFGNMYILAILYKMLGILNFTYNYNDIEYLSSLLPIIGVILSIICRIKYPHYTFGKIIMWIYIVLIVFYILFFIFIIIACNIMCSGLGSMG